MEYHVLVGVYRRLEKTTKRLEKTEILTSFLKKAPAEELNGLVSLLQGRIFPEWEEKKIGFSSRLMLKAIAKATGASAEEVENLWSKMGDLGLVAEKLVLKKKQITLTVKKLTVDKVLVNIRKLAELEGEGTVEKKVSLIAELLSFSSAEEACFIVRMVLEQLRVGIAAGIVRDAIAGAFDYEAKEVESAHHVLGDYGEVARLAKEKKLSKAKLKVGKPVSSMLALLVSDIDEAFGSVGTPALFEYKLDGFRLQIHKDQEIKLFTRRLENVTKQFPDVVELVKKNVKGNDFILDTEAAGYDAKTGKYLPFQKISQRIRRKYDIADMAKKFPVEINVFDVLYYDGKDYMGESQKTRRELIQNIIKQEKGKIIVTKGIITSSKAEAKDFYKESLEKGNEGLMVKKLDIAYKPGRYVEGWVKLKPTLEPLDLVIVGADSGTGKRSGMLTSFVLACRSNNKLLTCGMVSTGLKEKAGAGATFFELSKMLESLIIKKEGRSVEIKPEIVVEVAYEEIQKSPTYTSGYALRFPRFKALRTDKALKDINALQDVERIYAMQKR